MDAESRQIQGSTTGRGVTAEGHKTGETGISQETLGPVGAIAPDRAACSVAGCNADAEWVLGYSGRGLHCDLHRAIADVGCEEAGIVLTTWRKLARDGQAGATGGAPAHLPMNCGTDSTGTGTGDAARLLPRTGRRVDGQLVALIVVVLGALLCPGCGPKNDNEGALWICGLLGAGVLLSLVVMVIDAVSAVRHPSDDGSDR